MTIIIQIPFAHSSESAIGYMTLVVEAIQKKIPMGSSLCMYQARSVKAKIHECRIGQLFGLLQRETCFEILLNRRIPNGTYGGVRGAASPSLLDPTEPGGETGRGHLRTLGLSAREALRVALGGAGMVQ